MPLAPGTKLGPYEIQSPIGAGGMGEVYRARDSRLERTVAIKVLPTHLNSSPELRARFEREAKAISGLQHPHICVLYDVGTLGDIDYLVMEHLEGDTAPTDRPGPELSAPGASVLQCPASPGTRSDTPAPRFYPVGNLASRPQLAHNPAMDFAQLFVGFLEPVAFGSVAVLALFGIVRLRSPRRSPALATRRPTR